MEERREFGVAVDGNRVNVDSTILLLVFMLREVSQKMLNVMKMLSFDCFV